MLDLSCQRGQTGIPLSCTNKENKARKDGNGQGLNASRSSKAREKSVQIATDIGALTQPAVFDSIALFQMQSVTFPLLEQPSGAKVLNLKRQRDGEGAEGGGNGGPAGGGERGGGERGEEEGQVSQGNWLRPLAPDQSMQQQKTIVYELALYFECNASIARFATNASWASTAGCASLVRYLCQMPSTFCEGAFRILGRGLGGKDAAGSRVGGKEAAG